jgi:hypothetical protein
MSYDLSKPCQDSRKPEERNGHLFASCVAVGTDKKPCQAARTTAKESMTVITEFSLNGM